MVDVVAQVAPFRSDLNNTTGLFQCSKEALGGPGWDEQKLVPGLLVTRRPSKGAGSCQH